MAGSDLRLDSTDLLIYILDHPGLPQHTTKIYFREETIPSRKVVDVQVVFHGFSWIRRWQIRRHFDWISQNCIFSKWGKLQNIYVSYIRITDDQHPFGNRQYSVQIKFEVTENMFPILRLKDGYCIVKDGPSKWVNLNTIDSIENPGPQLVQLEA